MLDKEKNIIKKMWNIDRCAFDYHIYKNGSFLITCQNERQAAAFLKIIKKEN